MNLSNIDSNETDVDFRSELIKMVTECKSEEMVEYMYYFMLTKLQMSKRKESLV